MGYFNTMINKNIQEDRLDRKKTNGIALMVPEEHSERELDPALTRTGRLA